MVDLKQLSLDITQVGLEIKELKTNGTNNKDLLTTKIQSLLQLKQTYAENNNGIGVDGKPFGGTTSKKEMAADSNKKHGEDPNSKGAQKKALKKAAAAEKRAELKSTPTTSTVTTNSSENGTIKTPSTTTNSSTVISERPPPPKQNNVVVVGGGDPGKQDPLLRFGLRGWQTLDLIVIPFLFIDGGFQSHAEKRSTMVPVL